MKPTRRLACLAPFFAALSSPIAHGATWTQLTSGGNWDTSGNWSGGIPEGSTAIADFSTLNITADNTVHLDSAHIVNSLIFGDTTTSSAANWILDNNGSSTNTLTLAGTTPTITVNALGTGKTATISAIIAGTTLTKAGTGTLVLSAANTYTGLTTVTAGTLQIGGTQSSTSGYAFAQSATTSLEFLSGSNITLSGSGTGIVMSNGFNNSSLIVAGTVSNAGELKVRGTNGGFGFNLNSGADWTQSGVLTIQSASSGASAVMTVAAGSLFKYTNTLTDITLSNSTSTGSGSGTLSIAGGIFETGRKFNNSGGTGSGAANLVISNGGTLKWTGATSALTSSSGTGTAIVLQLQAGGGTIDQSGTGLLTVANNLNGFAALGSSATAKTITLQGSTAGAGAFIGNIGDTTNGTTTNTATAAIGATTITLSSVSGLNIGSTIAGNGITAGTTITNIAGNVVTVSAATTAANNANTTFTFGGVTAFGANSVLKSGTSTWILSGANTYSGTTTVTSGTLTFRQAASFYNSTINSTTAAKLIVNSGATAGFTLGGVGDFTEANITTLLAASDGTVGFKTGSSLGIDTTNAGGTYALGLAIGNPNGNAIGLNKLGAGTLAISQANTYTGDTTVTAGEVTVSGNQSAANGSWILRGGGDTGSTFNTVATTVTFNSGSTVAIASGKTIQLGNTGAAGGFQHQTLTANGTVTNSGTLFAGRGGDLNVGGVWTQNGAATVASQGGTAASFTVASGGQFTYNSATNFLLSSSASANVLTTLTVDGGVMTTGVKFHNGNATAVAGASSDIILSNGGTLKLSANVTDLFTTAGGTNRFQLGTGGGIVDTNGSSTALNLAITGTGGLTKAGGGTLTLGSGNTYNGITAVNAGTLLVSGSIGSSAVTVSNTGTVLASGTTGTIGDSVTINNGAILAAGGHGASGTATVTNATTFNNGSIFSWDINSTGTSYDKLVTSGTSGEAATGDAVFRVVLADSSLSDNFWTTSHTWNDIFTSNGTAAIADWANLFTLSVVNSSFQTVNPTNGTFSISGNTLSYNFSAVPEPTSAIAGLLIGAGLLRRRRKN